MKERLPMPTSGTIGESLQQMEKAANDKLVEQLQLFELQLEFGL